MNNFKEKLQSLPMCPGVYIMKNSEGEIIYVGKSKLLKNRVSQYFQRSSNHTPKTISMVEHIADFDYIITDTEVEALILECNLIKKYKPKYNILLKDDKQYPYIKITMQEEYPRIFMTRRVVKDGSKYFGPYMSAFMVKETLETIKKIFQVRSCSKSLPRDIGKSRPCLYYHINQCSAPCDNRISKEDYRDVFEQISNVLEGNYSEIMKQLEKKMFEASAALEFERAARYRDRIESIKILGEKQKIISTKENNRDIIGLFREGKEACVQVFYMRDGKVVGSEYFIFENTQDTDCEIIEGFLKQLYFTVSNIPKEIVIGVEIEETDSIQTWLSQKCGYKIRLIVPKRGDKAKILEMVNKNAHESLKQHKFKRNKEQTKQNEILSELMKVLNLDNPPFRIESYDISNISGSQSIGACIVYKDAKPVTSEYRKFNIRTVEGANDYESMREVIYRRINKYYEENGKIKNGELTQEKAKFIYLPDLILLDGGKGHVSAIKQLFDTLGEEIPVYGMVKDDKHRTRGLTDENREIPIDLDGKLFKFLTCMQDEVHRFAISAYRKKHEKSNTKSELEDIPGIGPNRRIKLLSHFINIDRIKNATYEELCSVVDKKAAKNVFEYFNKG